jgi:tRNA nucleotidyltransferase (CCA-adding enzyme)
LALHRDKFPIRHIKDIVNGIAAGSLVIRNLGMVDCQRRDRIGPGASLLDHVHDTQGHVTVIDHHVDQDSDVGANVTIVERVGSVSTIVAEMCEREGIVLGDVEATLLALGLHGDTGSLTFDSATPRDALALAWLMSQGASQVSAR